MRRIKLSKYYVVEVFAQILSNNNFEKFKYTTVNLFVDLFRYLL